MSILNDMTITPDYLKSLLTYDPATGDFRWKVRRGGKANAGAIAGAPDTKGKRQIRLCGRPHFAHRLAFLYMLGRWPEGEVDHKDRDITNNRWDNLREATGSQNCCNRVYQRDLPTGVYRAGSGNLFAAIEINGKLKYLGMFPTAEEAHKAYLAEAVKKHGAFSPFSSV
jgi:hypothetical protein